MDNGPDLETAYAFLDANFRPEGEWRQGEIYVFVETMELSSFFHAASPHVEGRDRTNSQDANGVLINQELRAAALAGGDSSSICTITRRSRVTRRPDPARWRTRPP